MAINHFYHFYLFPLSTLQCVFGHSCLSNFRNQVGRFVERLSWRVSKNECDITSISPAHTEKNEKIFQYRFESSKSFVSYVTFIFYLFFFVMFFFFFIRPPHSFLPSAKYFYTLNLFAKICLEFGSR